MPYKTYEAHFYQKHDEIFRNIEYFEKESGLLDSALQILPCKDLQLCEWERIASATEQEKSDCNIEGTVFTEDLGFNVCPDMPEIMNTAPELGNDSEVPYIIEKQEHVLNFEEYSKLIQTLNAEQKDIFNIILNWCRNLRKSQKIFQNLSICLLQAELVLEKAI